jgi:glyoxylase-like metal-dependent hydrolase (beta-lactamase superfamily II)
MYPIQLFDTESSTFTYLLVAEDGKRAVIIDPVARHLERDLTLLDRLGVELDYVLETHAHADHVTSAGALCLRTDAVAATPRGCGIERAPLQLDDRSTITFGTRETILALHTPGHTAGSMSYLWRDNVFTGDTLLIDGCGRTDFQGGDPLALYESITTRLFTLPDATCVWPGHDYNGQSVSTIGWERRHNRRLAGRDRAGFVELMRSLDLPKPRLIDVAVPANRALGLPAGDANDMQAM